MTTLNAAQIQAALQKLDVGNDNHWTSDGLPRLDTVKMIAGDQSLTRDVVTQAAPGFSRAAALQGAAASAPPAPPAPVAAAADPAASATEGSTSVPPPPPPAPPAAPAPDAGISNEPTIQPVSTTAETGLPSQGLILSQAFATPPPQLENREEMQARLDTLNLEIAQISKAEAEIKKEKQARQTEADDLIGRIDKATPKDSNQQGIMDYLASQQQKLVGRAAQIKRVTEVEKDLGVKLSDLVPKRSPLDASMARKTGYGRNRPGA